MFHRAASAAFLLALFFSIPLFSACVPAARESSTTLAKLDDASGSPAPAAAHTPPASMLTLEELLANGTLGPEGRSIVSGFWGYTQDQPCIMGNPFASTDREFAFIPLEYEFAKLRFMQEFSQTPPKGERYVMVGMRRDKQALVSKGDRKYDKLTLTALLVHERDWPELGKRFMDKEEAAKNPVDIDDPRMVQKTQDFWFDITAPFAHNAGLLGKSLKKTS